MNETESGIKFYLVKIEAYKIGNSEPAAKFSIITGPSEKTEIVGKEKKELAARHEKRYDFWKILLEKCKTKTNLHANISPSIYSWIGTSSGKRGLNLNYAATNKYGQVELYIDRGKETEEENKRIFDQLYSHRQEIEKDFGDKLNWERLNDRRASRISKRFNYAGLNEREKWDKLQADMIDAMVKIDKALNKHIKALKI